MFCGQCGHPLATSHVPSNYPREGFDEAEALDIQQIDPRIPANEYTEPRVTRRAEPTGNSAPRGPFSRAYDASQEPPRNQEIEPRRNQEQVTSRKTETVASASSATNSTSIFGLENIERPKFETDPYSVKPVSNSMFDFEPVGERSGPSIHGPSFLGLSEPDFLDEEEKPSHARRNWLLVALAVVIVIGAVQWRNIRDTGIQYAGTLHFKFPSKKGQGQVQVAPEQVAPSENGQTASSEPGQPSMEVNPTTNGAAPATTASGDQPKPADENLLTAQPAANTAQPADSHNTDSTAGNDANSKSAAQTTARQEEKASAAAGESQKNASAKSGSAKSAAVPAKNSEVAEARPPTAKAERAARAKPKTETPEAPKRAPGSDEVARAISASDPATAANWLWAAVKKGNKEAPVLLADYYAKGRGVPKDCEQATVLLRSAASAGNPRASARLGMYYATGQCVRRDRSEAWRWLSAAHAKDPASDWIDQYRRHLWTQMTPEERARAGSGPTASE
ncbi:MAG: hypothetical protein ROO76_07545 [Terriglobia bacterium]|nr:hypothetical protein [Terriglobia bacterium]